MDLPGCDPVTSLEDAEKEIPSAILPIRGLRRDAEGDLTPDALRTVLDGLRTKGIDAQDSEDKEMILRDTGVLLCRINGQYQFLLRTVFQRMDAGQPVPRRLLERAKEKNLTMLDLLSISRHVGGIPARDESKIFTEGWQTGNKVKDMFQDLMRDLKEQAKLMENFDSGSVMKLRQHMVDVTTEKNRWATNSLGLFGFLNLVAIGMLIYISSAR
jgi:hypothetical protein